MNKFSENIGIVGQGFVGTAVKEKFKEYYNVYTYDKYNTEKSRIFAMDQISEDEIDLATLVENCETVFVCVPTPMFPNGQCDTSIVDDVILRISNISTRLDRRTSIILKSTVPPGTTRSLDLDYDNVIVNFSPEFLTEANSIEDFRNQNRIILGIDWIELVEPLTAIFRKVFPEAEIGVMRSDEAEMSKYVINLFLATKVSFFNDIYKVIEKINSSSASINMSFEAVVGAALMDPRIGKSHFAVPGPDGDYGYGGHCFPKDMAAILHIADTLKLSVPTLLGASTTNSIVRQNRDWENMPGRAVSFIEEESEIELNDIENEL